MLNMEVARMHRKIARFSCLLRAENPAHAGLVELVVVLLRAEPAHICRGYVPTYIVVHDNNSLECQRALAGASNPRRAESSVQGQCMLRVCCN